MTDGEKVEWVKEHLAYEMKMLQFTLDRIRKLPAGLEWNAYYESFIVHARNIYDFLRNNDGGRQRPIASEFVPFKLKSKITSFDDVHEQVLHMGRNRPFDPALKFDSAQAMILAASLKDAFGEFIRKFDAAFPSKWNAELTNPYRQPASASVFPSETKSAGTVSTTTTTTTYSKSMWRFPDDSDA